ncbi:Acidic mammalian chitinase [Portunus trituberculatus]|uniref:Acidic mammalian chitinase n=1 Tax=Portunus trituberculatus TaxID=210409 RepID=A0A5B7ES26_PORTR|nr:Acidic mammalian chitinase [Portunus trituberculatus]
METQGVMVCYYGSWAVYRPGDGMFDVEDIDPNLCTHLIFGFAGLGSNNKIKVLDPWNELCDDYGLCAFDRFTALKKKNTNLVTILAVGGWNEGSTKYSHMASSAASRKTFVDSAIKLLKDHDFDGLDMDWEYPTQRGGNPEDRANFVLLLKDLKEALHANGMMLTAAVSAGKGTIDEAYDIPGIAQHLDMANLMTYDMHGDWDPYTHHQSGLYAHPDDTGDNVYFNQPHSINANNNNNNNVSHLYSAGQVISRQVFAAKTLAEPCLTCNEKERGVMYYFLQDFAVRYWLDNGFPAEKLTQGVPLYGRCWTLDSADQHGFYAPAHQPGPGGKYTEEPGMLGYNEICEGILDGWTVVHDPAMHEPYVYSLKHGNVWCSYDDEPSAKLKAEYAKEKGLAGMMVWSIDTDDFKGKCGRKFALIKTLVETFTGNVITPGPTLPPTTRDPDATTTEKVTRPPTPPPDDVCKAPGINADPDNCHHYWLCSIVRVCVCVCVCVNIINIHNNEEKNNHRIRA